MYLHIVTDRTQTLVGGLMQKGALKKVSTLVRGDLEKITNFPATIEFTWFSLGLTHECNAKKGGAWHFLRSRREFWKISQWFFVCNRPPHKCLWKVPNAEKIFRSYQKPSPQVTAPRRIKLHSCFFVEKISF